MADDRFVDSPPAGADAWRDVWESDARYRARPSRFEPFLRAFRRLVRRALEPDDERQRNFNITLLQLVADLREERRLLRQDIETVQRDLRRDVESVKVDLVQEISRLRELIVVAARRTDALVAALDQKVESTAVRIRDLTNPPAGEPSDVLYRRIEDALRGGETEVREDVAPYVRLAADHPPVLDVGCGRGEFLAACREQKVDARGVDVNERSVADLRQRGLEAALGAVPSCFEGLADGSLGSILAVHVVEHLPHEALFALFREARRVLRPGGLLMIETPNAESIAMAASDFWRDPTHIAPRHPAALTVLAREHGFEIAEIRAVHELPEGVRIPLLESDPVELQRVIAAINERFFAPQDLRLVVRKGV